MTKAHTSHLWHAARPNLCQIGDNSGKPERANVRQYRQASQHNHTNGKWLLARMLRPEIVIVIVIVRVCVEVQPHDQGTHIALVACSLAQLPTCVRLVTTPASRRGPM